MSKPTTNEWFWAFVVAAVVASVGNYSANRTIDDLHTDLAATKRAYQMCIEDYAKLHQRVNADTITWSEDAGK